MKKIVAKYISKGLPADLVDAAKRTEIASAEFERNSIPGLATSWSQALVDPADEAKVSAAMARVLDKDAQAASIEFRLLTGNGSQRWVENRYTPVRDKDGRLHVALVNVNPSQPVTITAQIPGGTATGVTGRVLTAAAINAHNTFDQPAVVKPAAFTGAAIESGSLKATLPPKSVVVLDLK